VERFSVDSKRLYRNRLRKLNCEEIKEILSQFQGPMTACHSLFCGGGSAKARINNLWAEV
jgi:hypothetical protein